MTPNFKSEAGPSTASGRFKKTDSAVMKTEGETSNI